ncbi:MAG TPA: hypothetical protein VF734_19370 [Pseudonocardiaceae bacterium]
MIGCLGHGLAPGERAVLEQTAKLAEDVFAARADGYDRRAAFPAEDFDDLLPPVCWPLPCHGSTAVWALAPNNATPCRCGR